MTIDQADVERHRRIQGHALTVEVEEVVERSKLYTRRCRRQKHRYPRTLVPWRHVHVELVDKDGASGERKANPSEISIAVGKRSARMHFIMGELSGRGEETFTTMGNSQSEEASDAIGSGEG